jgi:site-specific recombinase XerD
VHFKELIMASFIYRLNRPKDKDGNLKKSAVALQLRATISQAERFDLNTGLKVVPIHWNANQKLLKASAKGSPELNGELQKLKAKVELAYLRNRELPLQELRLKLQAEISPVLHKETGVPLISEAFSLFMADMKGIFSDHYLRGYHQVINFVKGKDDKNGVMDVKVARQRDVAINKVGYEYIKQYQRWLVDAGLSDETRKNHLKYFKKVLSVNADLYELDKSFTKVKGIKVGRKKPFWLSHDEIRLIIGHRFKTMRMQRVADEYLFRYFCGLRDQDSEQIRHYHIKTIGEVTYLDFNMLKNGRDFLLPLNNAALAILEKYDFDLPRYTNQEKNRIIKLCFKEVGLTTLVEEVSNSGSTRTVTVREKWELVTTHSARRSFGRRWMDTNKDIEALSQYFGHSSSRTTRAYIGWELEEYASYVNALDFG